MADIRSIASKALSELMRGHQQHHATPERKERRRIVKLAGRRQAVQHFKDMRVIEKLKSEVRNG